MPVTPTENDSFLPEAFRERMKLMLGDEYPSFIASYAKPRQPSLRVNPLKIDDISRDSVLRVLPFPLERIEWAGDGFRYPDDEAVRPGRHPYHDAGLYYIQEASAMIPASLRLTEPGEKVLDLCAAPGGKATQAAAALRGKGLLAANEIISSRAAILSQNVERMGIRNAIVTNESPEALARRFPLFFDHVIVDAPCSGEGMFRKEEQALTMWSQENVLNCAARQRDILTEADRMLAPGGYLTYSTCTFAPEENEEILAWFLTTHPEYTVETPRNELVLDCLSRGILDHGRPEWVKSVPTDTRTNDMIRNSVRLFPHHADGEGHFAALLRKSPLPASEHTRELPALIKQDKNRKSGKKPVRPDPLEEAAALFDEFCREVIGQKPSGTPCLFGDVLYLLPDADGITPAVLDGLHVLRAGLQVGLIKNGRFEPSHALALALDADTVKQTFAVDAVCGQEALYLRGEVLPCPASFKSWHLVTLRGYPLGWGKAVDGMMKNHYPKGLRKP